MSSLTVAIPPDHGPACRAGNTNLGTVPDGLRDTALRGLRDTPGACLSTRPAGGPLTAWFAADVLVRCGCSESGEELQQQGVDLVRVFLLDPVAAVVQYDRRAGLGRVCGEFSDGGLAPHRADVAVAADEQRRHLQRAALVAGEQFPVQFQAAEVVQWPGDSGPFERLDVVV